MPPSIANQGLPAMPLPPNFGAVPEPLAERGPGLSPEWRQRLDAAVTLSLRRSGDEPDSASPAPVPEFSDPVPVPMNRLQAVSTLQRNERLFEKPKSVPDLQRIADDPRTAPELGRALRTVLSDEELKDGLDSASNGRTDGRIGRTDLHTVAESTELIRYNRRRAESFRHNYLPSDGGGTVREMTRHDAARELYKYSDYLPKTTSLETLRELVDGTLPMDRRPPQVIAAARYLASHPEEWECITGRPQDEAIPRAALADALAGHIRLRPEERRAVRTIERHADDFFDGRLFDRDKLRRIAEDPQRPRAHTEAALVLLGDPVLFGLLDNAERGHKSNAWRSSDDGRIGRNDLRRFLERVDRTEGPPPVAPPAVERRAERPADGEVDIEPPVRPFPWRDPAAVREMVDGRWNQPDPRTEKGGKLRRVVTGVMKGFSIFEKIGSTTLGAIAALKIPILSQVAAVGSMVSNAIAGGLDVGRTAIDGGDVKKAAANAGKSFGSNALSVLTAPGAGKAVTASASVVGKTAAKAAVKETGKQVFNEVVKPKAEELMLRRPSPQPSPAPRERE
ncbi:HrpF/NolX family T3SS translocon protein [Roseateles sp. 22389]|uniref:HrpF/NolX family T3SS translocon protein n=1 Tax=Roseateles sp. 22389 TaxID=3453916 RepID=UPI003F840FEE